MNRLVGYYSKGLIGFGGLALFVGILLLIQVSCQRSEELESKDLGWYGKVQKIEFEGHTYVIWASYNRGTMLHDPDCRCGIHKGQ